MLTGVLLHLHGKLHGLHSFVVIIEIILGQLIRIVEVLRITQLLSPFPGLPMKQQNPIVLFFGRGFDSRHGARRVLEDFNVIERLGLGILLFLRFRQQLVGLGLKAVGSEGFLAFAEEGVTLVVKVIRIVLRLRIQRGRKEQSGQYQNTFQHGNIVWQCKLVINYQWTKGFSPCDWHPSW